VSRRGRIVLAGILAAAAGIRLYRLGHFSYGLDEVMQAFWLRGDWAFFWKSLRFDAVHPPLDYLLDRLALAARPSDELLKVVPVLWGVAAVGALGLLVARRAGEAAGLAAAAVLALAPYHVRYSQELRPYSLGLLLLCLSLLALDRFLERPGAARLVLLYLACLATMYALYLAALALALAAAAMLVEDAFDPEPVRRSAARRFLAWSPAFGAALWVAYLPWWPVVREAARRPAVAAPPPLTALRVGQTLSFFAFAPADGEPVRRGTAVLWTLVALGAVLAGARRRQRTLVAWLVAGLASIEILAQAHPHYFGNRIYLPAGIAATALAGVAIGELLRRPVTRLGGALVLAAVLVLGSRGLVRYFRDGRADWRTLADYLRVNAAPSERVFTENQYASLCLAFYLDGPEWLYQVMEKAGTPERDIPCLEGEAVRLTWAWKPGTRAWLVLAGEPRHMRLRGWAEQFPGFELPTAEGAVLRRLDPERRDASLALISSAHGP
jgi:hypothetical protein